jgi:hypothetical protein
LEESLSSCFVQPSLIVGFDVGPSRLDLSAEVPDELAGNGLVKDVEDAVSESLNISIAEPSGIAGALTVFDS